MPGAVDLGDAGVRGAGRHQVGALDQEMRGGEPDLARPPRFPGEEGHVPGPGRERVGHLTGRGVLDQLDGHVEPPA